MRYNPRIFFVVVFLVLASLAVGLSSAKQGQVQHFVAFRFLPSVGPSQQQEVMDRFLALKQLCRNATTGLPYIASLDAGYANSPEGADQKMQEGFIVTFNSVADRDYYVGRPFYFPYDPHHDAFKQYVGPLLDKNGVYVFDFTVV
jgi:hypothetical protein